MALYRKLHFTDHAKLKMRQYGISKSKLLRLLARPERKEQGIAPGTTALMQTKKIYGSGIKLATKPTKAPGETWLMYRDEKGFRKIISAWYYPGISKPGESIPIPEDILQELKRDRKSVV